MLQVANMLSSREQQREEKDAVSGAVDGDDKDSEGGDVIEEIESGDESECF